MYVVKQIANTYINKMVQSHDPPLPESGRDEGYYKHVMKDFHEQYDSVGQTSQFKDNRMNTPTFTITSCTQASPASITTTPVHEYQAQTRAGVSEVISPVKMNCLMIFEIT
jgi:hypothetical protein